LIGAADAPAQGSASAASQDPEGYVGRDLRVRTVPSLHRFVGHLAAAFYGHPSRCIPLVAVTGTNGKTSVSHWIAAHWSAPSAVVGTLGERIFTPESASEPEPLAGADPSNAALTTPDAVALQTQLQRVAGRGAQVVAIEASSIGLHQGRLQGCTPTVAVYTQLSRDHLDYHGSMQDYAQAKSTLFRLLGRSPWGAHAVVHLDDVWTPTMVDACPFGVALLFFGLGEDFDLARARARELAQPSQRSSALLWARLEDGFEDDSQGMRLHWRYIASGGDLRPEPLGGLQPLSLLGRFNALNALAVAASWIALGRPVKQALEALSGLRPVEGRMERLGGGSAPLVVVDYAHTPDALEQVLIALRPLARRRRGRLICVVGAGGDRDAGKRPLIGAIAVRHADRVCFTSDNPRDENPLQIIEQILSGACATPDTSLRGTEGCAAVNPWAHADQAVTSVDAALRHQVVSTEVDRAVAIDQTIAEAAQEDLVLIAGKGHESYQEIGGKRLPFNDRQQAALALARHWSLAANVGVRQ
jgi:UDP-N-acetylmuramyl-tripeptide synthetase